MKRLRSKIQILNEMWKTVGILMFKENKTQEEIDLLYICTEFFNSSAITKFINLFETVSDTIDESSPVSNLDFSSIAQGAITNNPDQKENTKNEAFALFTGMAVAGLNPVVDLHPSDIDPAVEQAQMEEFHKMMECL